LRTDFGISDALIDIFKAAFNINVPSTSLMMYCEAHFVEYSFSSW